ncbi:dipeptide transporter; membrane component of ABC superfamily [Candidatus Promineifilum breve]|uniref:Dipeptide transporter membrane component of ABC superfamily n=1 Tax=Candidatus Promineifilum breve TaxID=1806508 RepID=A0A160SY57_9CHLR|nr:ABC transporter permease [Candidatus Promineifilum breve]CUS02166.2 dipeptide transporter; membrane component of ABC superfamily [Candidatus Promineifilum breve]
MTQYAIRRLLAAIPVVIGVLIVTFALARAIPGEPCTAMFGEKATPEVCAVFNAEKGLDKPLTTQFAIFARDMLRGDFGESIRFKRSVMEILIERLPQTIELGMTSVILAVSIGIPLGIISALRRNSLTDVATMVGANIGVSMPVFWLGLMLIYIFALLLKDTPFQLPPSGRLSPGVNPIPFYEVYGWQLTEGTFRASLAEFISNFYIFNSLITADWEVFIDAVRHLILPAVALATIPLAIIARMTRSAMLEVLGQDYVRTAKAKGLRQQQVVMKHAFRNALLPIVTIIGLQFGLVLSGAILTETTFGLAGVGRSLYEAITARDYPIIQGFVVVIAIGYVMVNLIVDLSYAILDPRIQLD